MNPWQGLKNIPRNVWLVTFATLINRSGTMVLILHADSYSRRISFFQFLGGLPLYIVHKLKYSTSTFGILMAVNTVLIIIVEVPLNNAMTHWDDRKSLALGAFLCAIGFGAMVFSQSLVLIIVTIIIWTFGGIIFFPSSTSYTAILSPEHRRGEYMGYFQMTFSFSLMVGPWIGALVLDYLGSTVLCKGSFVLGVISTISFLLLNKYSTREPCLTR